MSEPTEATKLITEFYAKNHIPLPIRLGWVEKKIIQRLLDEQAAKVERLKLIINNNNEKIETQRKIIEDHTTGQYAEIDRLRQKLDRAKEYLVELRGVWSWRKNEPRNRNAKEYDELDSFIKQLAEATNPDGGGD